MAEDILITGQTKEEKYRSLLPQIEHLIDPDVSFVANVGNIMAALKVTWDFLWVGLYEVHPSQKELRLHVFQGPPACTRIAFGKGVCGHAWQTQQTILVEDVNAFPGHIACSSLSQSEIVIPGFNAQGEVIFVLDVDSILLNNFDAVDQIYLEKIVKLIEKLYD